MKTLKCKCGQDILVDDDLQLPFISWSCTGRNSVSGTVRQERVEIVSYVYPDVVGILDHKDRNFHNNQRDNLRPATKSQNNANQRLRKDSTSGYKGVSYNKRLCKWNACCMFQGKNHWIGTFKSRDEAALAYNKKALELHGEFAVLNIISDSVGDAGIVTTN